MTSESEKQIIPLQPIEAPKPKEANSDIQTEKKPEHNEKNPNTSPSKADIEYANNLIEEREKQEKVVEVARLSGLAQGIQDSVEFHRCSGEISKWHNENKKDEDIVRFLGIPEKMRATLTSEEIVPFIKRYRAETYLQTAEKANPNDPAYQKLKQLTQYQQFSEFQENLYFNKDIVQAFNDFINTPKNKEFFGNEETMINFFTSEYYRDTLIHIVNKQIDDPKEITAHYFKKNMDYRSRVRREYKITENNDIKKDFDIATQIFRKKTDILKNKGSKTLEVLSQEMNEFLATETEGGETYLQILTKVHNVIFFKDTVISAIRLEEKDEKGTIDFNNETTVYDLTDLQFFLYVFKQFNRQNNDSKATLEPFIFSTDIQEARDVLAAIQANGIGGKTIEGSANKIHNKNILQSISQ
ncbi:MAG: hypothetical protein LBU27_02255 [Candidatus Peribacteria bacterium]|nr:hypothetical protein [Candidatus Peribacteria bacterium]